MRVYFFLFINYKGLQITRVYKKINGNYESLHTIKIYPVYPLKNTLDKIFIYN